jgi:hypothetical protein
MTDRDLLALVAAAVYGFEHHRISLVNGLYDVFREKLPGPLDTKPIAPPTAAECVQIAQKLLHAVDESGAAKKGKRTRRMAG